VDKRNPLDPENSLLNQPFARVCFTLDSISVLYSVQCVNGLLVTDTTVRRFINVSNSGTMHQLMALYDRFSVLKEICCNINSKCYGFSLQMCHLVLTAFAQLTDQPLKVQ
jgi:hypothetical protein